MAEIQASKFAKNSSFHNYRSKIIDDKVIISLKARPKILLLDDDPIFRELIRKVAKRNNIQIYMSHHAEDFQALLDGNHFDVVIIDYYLDDQAGGINGCDVLREANVTAPTILVSGKPGIELDDLPQCVQKCIHKTLGPAEIIDVARSYC